MATATSYEVEERTLIYRMPVVDEQIDAILTIPALQAYRDSPRWEPIVCADGVIYVWGSSDPEEIEAILIPTILISRSWMWTLYTRTRSKKKPYIIMVNPRVVGGRVSNIFKEPAIVTTKYRNEYIVEWLLTKTTILEDLQLKDCTVDVDNVKCEKQDYTVLYSVKLDFNELYFIPTVLQKDRQ